MRGESPTVNQKPEKSMYVFYHKAYRECLHFLSRMIPDTKQVSSDQSTLRNFTDLEFRALKFVEFDSSSSKLEVGAEVIHCNL